MLDIRSIVRSTHPSLNSLEIKLDTPTVSVAVGVQNERTQVRGEICLVNHSNVWVERITISLLGRQVVLWYTDTMSCQRVKSKDVFFSTESCLFPWPREKGSRKPCLIEAGSHAWPFELTLGPRPFETISGLRDSFATYQLSATIVTAGYLQRNIKSKKQIRVIRAPCFDEASVIEPEQVDCGKWRDKLDYLVATSPHHHQWGQSIPVCFDFWPHVNGVIVEYISLRLQELVCLRASEGNRDLYNSRDLIVSQAGANAADHSALLLQATTDPLHRHAFEMMLSLPRSLTKCRQSIQQDRIFISHRLLVDVRMHDGAGAVHNSSHEFPFNLRFPSGITFDDESASLQRQDVLSRSGAPPAFGDHYNDAIVLPGVVPLASNEHREQHAQMRLIASYGLRSPCTTQVPSDHLTGRNSGQSNWLEPNQLDSLDRVPSYNTTSLFYG
ncbi:hypothetical protein IQ07DRAFT_127016 [Pyrenochaeta sp. DS3sAY3a]|nr:hypothetical protein IQ07DRAFT_127016 [Pyrenochaeta sp. DS3sAY3a]